MNNVNVGCHLRVVFKDDNNVPCLYEGDFLSVVHKKGVRCILINYNDKNTSSCISYRLPIKNILQCINSETKSHVEFNRLRLFVDLLKGKKGRCSFFRKVISIL